MNQAISTADLFRQLVTQTSGGITALQQALRQRADVIDTMQTFLRDGTEQEKVMALIVLRDLSYSSTRVRMLAREALYDASSRVRSHAARLLASPEAAFAWPNLLEALKDPEDEVRYQVLLALASINPVQTENLLSAYLTSPTTDERERLHALALIRERYSGRLTSDVMALLHDPSPRVRAASVGALAVDDQAVREALIAALPDPDQSVRLAVLEALQQRAEHIALSVFIDALLDESPGVRLAALAALRKKGDSQVCADVVRLLDDPVPAVKHAAVAALGELRCQNAVGRLLSRAKRARRDGDKIAVLQALKSIDGERSRELHQLLQVCLLDESPYVRSQAVRTYAALFRDEAVPLLLSSLRNDKASLVRSEIALSLGHFTEQDAQDALVRTLKTDPDPQVRKTAARAISTLEDDRAIDTLRGQLADEDPQVRLEVIERLGLLKARQAIPDLVQLQRQETNYALSAAIRAALAQTDAGSFAGSIYMSPAVKLFDPRGVVAAFTVWLHDPAWYPVSRRIIFYNNGYVETIDPDEVVKVYLYTVEGHQITLTGDERQITLKFDIDQVIRAFERADDSRAYYWLTLSSDVFLDTDVPDEPVDYYTRA